MSPRCWKIIIRPARLSVMDGSATPTVRKAAGALTNAMAAVLPEHPTDRMRDEMIRENPRLSFDAVVQSVW